MSPFCQIEFVSSDSDVGTPCGNPAVAECADCGAAICSDCRFECCGDSFCGVCYDYHVTHSCVRKPVQNERSPYPVARLGVFNMRPVKTETFGRGIRTTEAATTSIRPEI